MVPGHLLVLGAGAAVGLWLVVGAAAIAILAFEVWMLIDVIRNTAISAERKVLWVIGMFLLHPFVAIVYYFTDRTRSRR